MKYAFIPGSAKIWELPLALKKGVKHPWHCAACGMPVQLRSHKNDARMMHYEKGSCTGEYALATNVLHTRRWVAALRRVWGITSLYASSDDKVKANSRIELLKIQGVFIAGFTAPLALCQSRYGPLLVGCTIEEKLTAILEDIESKHNVSTLLALSDNVEWSSFNEEIQRGLVWWGRTPTVALAHKEERFNKVASLSLHLFECHTRVEGVSFTPFMADEWEHYLSELQSISKAKKWSKKVSSILFDESNEAIWEGWFEARACPLQIPLMWLRYFFLERLTKEKEAILDFKALCLELANEYASQIEGIEQDPGLPYALAEEFEHDAAPIIEHLLHDTKSKGLIELIDSDAYVCNKALKV